MVKTPKSGGISQNMIMALIAVAFLLIAVSMFWQLTPQSKTAEKFEAAKLTVKLFYASWCGHCERYLASGDWDSISKTVSAKHDGVMFAKFDFDKTPKDETEKYSVNAFPTIVAEDAAGKVYYFHGDRSKAEHMEKFVAAALKSNKLERSDYD